MAAHLQVLCQSAQPTTFAFAKKDFFEHVLSIKLDGFDDSCPKKSQQQSLPCQVAGCDAREPAKLVDGPFMVLQAFCREQSGTGFFLG